jgi:hypothetical protein
MSLKTTTHHERLFHVPCSVAYDLDEDGLTALRVYLPILLIKEQLLAAAAPA